jgi:UDP-GlcNAc:undecaprenyl-phosphate GlcNAc-1-phosphate transferase
MVADKGHLHHRLVDKGFSQRETVMILYGISIAFGAAAVYITDSDPLEGTFVIVLASVLIVLVGKKLGLLNGENKKL